MTPKPIRALRRLAESDQGPGTLTVEQVEEVAALLVADTALDEIQRRSALSAQDIVSIIASYGEFIGQVNGAATTRRWDTASLPEGFSRKECGRDLRRAANNVAAWGEDPAMLQRWVMRANHYLARPITFASVALVHRCAQLDCLDALSAQGDSETARVLVAAWDLLEVSRSDALRALKVALSTPSAKRFDVSLITCRWLNEGAIDKVRRTRDVAGLAAAQQLLGHLMAGNASLWEPTGVADLNDGQVARIAEAAGIALEAASRRTETQVRQAITEAGLAEEMDVLYPGLTAAAVAGWETEIAPALQRRADGDPDWAERLNALIRGQ